MGTTVATNALLERKGEPTVAGDDQGFRRRAAHRLPGTGPTCSPGDIVLPEMLYERVIEVDERVSADGEVLMPLDATGPPQTCSRPATTASMRSPSCFMHGYRYPASTSSGGGDRRELGFTQVSVSHEVSPLMKLVSRGDTTVVDAYLSPILRRYVDRVATSSARPVPARLMFMQSNGGLTDAHLFQGKDSILLSGPAGGIVGAVAHRRGRRLRPHHRLRHGRHLDRRLALRRRVRARLRDRRSPACACARR